MSQTKPIPPDEIRCQSANLIPRWTSFATISAPIDVGEAVVVTHTIHRAGDEAGSSFSIRLSPDDTDRIADQLRTAASQAREYAKKLDECSGGNR